MAPCSSLLSRSFSSGAESAVHAGECYLRMMFLKLRHRLGCESPCAEVSDSISWRRFCRIPLDGTVP